MSNIKEKPISDDDSASITSSSSKTKTKDWLNGMLQKYLRLVQTDENKKIIQMFVLDPILNHVLERIFPYVLMLCILFILLTIMISLTLILVFTRLPVAVSDFVIV